MILPTDRNVSFPEIFPDPVGLPGPAELQEFELRETSRQWK